MPPRIGRRTAKRGTRPAFAFFSYHNGGQNTTATKNSFAYRGYYYDKDLEMYYLASRYYDAKIMRFISSDSYISTGQGILGNNMYAYCQNNPVSYVDPTGEFIVGVLVGGTIGGLAGALSG